MKNAYELWADVQPYFRQDPLVQNLLSQLGRPPAAPPADQVISALSLANAVAFGGLVTLGAGLLATGSVAADFSGSSGAFKTTSGVSTLGFGGVGIIINPGTASLSATGNFTINSLIFGGRPSATAAARTIPDPGASGTISVTSDGLCPLVSAGAEARALPDPTFNDQRITLCCDTHGGDITVTGASAIDSAGHTHIAFTAAGQACSLVAITVASARKWRLNGNDGATLS